MARLEVVPFSDEHLEAAAGLLAARHARHREAEPLLPELADPLAAVEREWREEGASGVFAESGYLIASPQKIWSGPTWMRVGIAGHAVDGDRERVRDLYAAAAQRWVDDVADARGWDGIVSITPRPPGPPSHVVQRS